MATAISRFELPEEAKTVPLPAQERLRLGDQQGFFPVGKTRGQEEKPEAIRAGKVRLLDLALEDNQLMAKQGIFCDQLGTSEGEIGGSAKEQGRAYGQNSSHRVIETSEEMVMRRPICVKWLAHEVLGKDRFWRSVSKTDVVGSQHKALAGFRVYRSTPRAANSTQS